ncbi:MAG: extracellular solute-binding protein [Dermatophilaceae bacterium]
MAAYTTSRRTLFTGLGATALLGGALAGCSSTDSDSNSAAANRAARLPDYMPYKGVGPDLAPSQTGVMAGYFRYPSDRPTSVAQRPGNGGTLSGLAHLFFAIPPGVDSNSYWAGLNDRLGVELDLAMTPFADWQDKFATTIAGDQIPDVLQMQIASFNIVANAPRLLEARFSPLEEYLSGAAIKDYPNLANIPTENWRPCVFNGALYGIPIPRGIVGNYHFIRADRFKAAGVSTEPKGIEELLEAGKALTDPKRRQWAYASINQPRNLLGYINEEPNSWREEGGKFTSRLESEEYKESLNDLIGMWKSGVVHPDGFSGTEQHKQLFASGTVAINAADGAPGYAQYVSDAAGDPNFELGLMPAYTRDGSRLAPWPTSNGVYSMTVLRKQDDPEKLKLALRVLNYLAAPFGTAEHAYLNFGEEGVDHKLDQDGNPVATPAGKTNLALPVKYLAAGPATIYEPGRRADTEMQHRYQTTVLADTVRNPTIGLYSNTQSTEGGAEDLKVVDVANAIIQGRRPFSDFDEAVATWRTTVGDKIRAEYEEQLQNAGARPTSS